MSYQINEIFYSLQGEGRRAGTPNVFVRFSGCNLRCTLESHGFDCDTEFLSGRRMELAELIQEMEEVGGGCRACILTGGEPALQVDEVLLKELRGLGWFVAIETNGTKKLDREDLFDWITVSPKSAEHTIRQTLANEVKYVRSVGQGIPRTSVESKYRYLSPAFDGAYLSSHTLQWCINLVKDNPEWSLSVQQHKSWKIR